MIVTDQPDDVRREVQQARRQGILTGVVPTMGALHPGHMSLVQTARKECGFVVVTIFVNPTQFGPNEDYNRYPRPLEDDLKQCRDAGVDLVFRPTVQTMYPEGYSTFVDVEGLSTVLEGAFRPGHFRGVATVVLKLFQLVGADVAYFGRKDYQQQLLVKKLCRDLNVPVEIRTCPTVREADGLALSSRNRYLDADQRKTALALSQSLNLARKQLLAGERNLERVRSAMRAHLDTMPGIAVDYVTVTDAETLEEISEPRPKMVALVAARVGTTRLIDNLPIECNPSS